MKINSIIELFITALASRFRLYTITEAERAARFADAINRIGKG